MLLPPVLVNRLQLTTLFVGLAFLAPPLSGTASAESVDDLWSAGVAFRAKGKPADALAIFERAYAVSPEPRFLGQVALCEEELERWVEASEHLAGALAAEDKWTRKHRGGLEAELAKIRGHVGEISFTGPAGVEIFVGDRRAGVLPLARPIRVTAGRVVVRAVSPDFEPFAKAEEVIGGGKSTIALALTSVAPVVAAVSAPPVRPPSIVTLPPPPQVVAVESRTWKTPAGVGIGVAGLGLLTWGVVWIAIDGNADGVCDTCRPRVRTTKTAGWILAGAGTSAVLGGGLLLYSDAGGTKVALGPTTSGLLLAGAF